MYSELLGIMFWMLPTWLIGGALVAVGLSARKWWVPLLGLPVYILNVIIVIELANTTM